MTALTKYQRLECPGLWRESAGSQRREVVVAFREATLVLADPRTETAITHWSLPAVLRLNPGGDPAIYAPAADSVETLELDDPHMIAALETVRGAVSRATARPGRVRGIVVGVATALILGVGLLWVPGALVAHTASVLPPSTRSQIGQMALADLEKLTGAPCSTPLGQRAAMMLADRVFGPGAPQLLILRNGLTGSANLPGGLILLAGGLIEAADGPDAAAGFALAEQARSTAEDPMLALLRHAGPFATFHLLTTGVLNPADVAGYGEVLLRRPPAPIADELLLARFRAAEVPSSPYAFALDPTGETTLPLIEADPFKGTPSRPLLEDGTWISLQAICAG